MKPPKKIPYGQCDFEKIRKKNYIYVDKTRFIEQIENENNSYHFLIRPRKFGKSLFLSVLKHYYDVCYKDDFETLFGDLYIGKNPTPKRNSLWVIRFSFSGLDTNSKEKFEESFTSAIRGSIDFFLVNHKSLLDNYKEREKELWQLKNVRAYIEFAFKIIDGFGSKAYIIIDEYDHFANDLIAMGTNLGLEQYQQLIWANGVVRDFYETLKDNTNKIIDTVFITGVTPMMLDDVTSGFNISNNLSKEVRYNEILGFTDEEVEFLIGESGIVREKIPIDRHFLYNGYLFHKNANNKLYNSAMILYLLDKMQVSGGEIEDIIDLNLKTDYSRIEMLLNKPDNIDKLEKIIEFGQYEAEVISRFSIKKIHEPQNFLSLLYYLGLVTIDKDRESGATLLKIPNYSVKTMYWEYMENIIKENNPQLAFSPDVIYKDVVNMAIYDDYMPFFASFHKNFISQISNQDLENFSEKNIKFFLLSILFQTSYYLPISELENSKGYSDIYMQARKYLYPKIKNDWVIELKYIKQSKSKIKKLIETKKQEAIEQLKRYKTSNMFKDRTDVRYLAVVFIGKKNYWISES